jgi:hypothetical protein
MNLFLQLATGAVGTQKAGLSTGLPSAWVGLGGSFT